MELLIGIALLCFLLGLLPVEARMERTLDGRWPGLGGALSECLKGIAAIGLSYGFNGSVGAMSLAALAVSMGRVWSPDPHYDYRYPKGTVTAGVTAGLIAPLVALLMLIIWLVVRWRRQPWTKAAIWASGFTPIVLFRFYEADVYFVFGSLIAGVFIYQYLRYVEHNCETPGEKPWSPSEKAHVKAHRLRVLMRRGGLATLIICLLSGFYLNRYVYRGFGQHVEIFRRGPSTLPLVAITFDDGPNPKYTPEILDILEEFDVKATFFMLGRNAELYPDLARRVAEEGHEIGNHTHRHARLLTTSYNRSMTEMVAAHNAIEAATGERITLFRPPQGLYGAQSLEAARDLRYTVVLWSVSSRDWIEIRPREMARDLVNRTRSGDIILFHDSGDLITYAGGNRTNTVAALPRVIEGLREQGFTFVTVTEMMIAHGLIGEEYGAQLPVTGP
ncbi:MAG: glycerol-3-phosphate acyltransferase [Bacillota bacterium]|jgi:peptidoglycan/xylan/chitin deacetylase (PgdA/CDA1 family)/glycerol-3-phosphate acyltransferase PlsY